MVLFFLLLSAALAAAGFAALLLIWLAWPSIEGFARGSWAKPAVAACRALLAAAGLLSKEPIAGTPAGAVDWWWVATLACVILGWLAWEIADWWAAEKAKAAREADEIEGREHAEELGRRLAEAEGIAVRSARASEFRARLLVTLRRLANTKNQRIRQSLTGGAKVPILRAREALAPGKHTGIALEELAVFLSRPLASGLAGTQQNFRVCLYVTTDGVLSPLDGFDLNERKHHPFTSYATHERHYRLDNRTDPAHAVRCIQERRLLIVADCATDPAFRYLTDGQPSYLKSLVAYPIIEFRETPGEAAAALVIDTDVAGYFREEDREDLEYLFRDFAARLTLEEAIRAAIT